MRRWLHGAGAVTVLVLAGCGSNAPSSTTAPVVLLEDYLSAGQRTAEQIIQQARDELAATENLIARCMKWQGFEYTPNTDTGSTAVRAEGDNILPDDRAWVEQYGYGVVDYPGRAEQLASASAEYVDPNIAYVESLTATEQAEYTLALYGDPSNGGAALAAPDDTGTNEMGTGEYRWQDGGCQGYAQHQYVVEHPDSNLETSDEFRPLFDALSEFYANLDLSSAMAPTDAAWASCMTDGGYPGFTAQVDARNYFINDVLGTFWDTEMTDWNWQTDGDPQLSPQYMTYAKQEIPLAVADLDCREQMNYRTIQHRLLADAESQFVADHKAELEAYQSAAEQTAADSVSASR